MISPINQNNQTKQEKLKSLSSSNIKTNIKTKKNFISTQFQDMMDEVLPPEELSNFDLNKLWKNLPQAEKNLINTFSQKNLDTYKNLVIQIAKLTLKRNTKVEMMKRNRSSDDHVVQSIIKVIDERLQKMVNLMHSKENTAFAILKSIEEIRGLLIDLKN